MEKIEIGYYPLRSYKNAAQTLKIQQLPLNQSNRIKTDFFCTVISFIFAILLLIGSIAVLDYQNLIKMTYPTDSDGRHCTLDNSKYNYLYFTSFTNPNKRVCVSSCPKGNQKKLNCWPTEMISCSINSELQHEVQIYSTIQQNTNIGLFCLPPEEPLRSLILMNANLLIRFNFVSTYRTIWASTIVSLTFGILYIIFLGFFTNFIVFFTIILGGLGSLVLGILFIFLKSNLSPLLETCKILFCVIIIMLGIFILFSAFFETKEITLCVFYLQRGYKSLSEFKGLVLLIPLFFIFMFGLIILFGFQFLSYWSNSKLKQKENQVYDVGEGTFSTGMCVLCVIQLIWGFSFLKEAFSFIISGTTVTWFFQMKHYLLFGIKNLFKFHWGSVVAGSFLLIFFYMLDLVYDIVKPSKIKSPRCYQLFMCIFDHLDNFLGLVRSQSMAFINITGDPYCNASRFCETIFYHSSLFQGSQSVNRYFRISSHILLSLTGTIFAVIYLQSTVDNPQVPALLVIFILNIFVVTFFVSLPSDMAEAILTCQMIKKYLSSTQKLNQPNIYIFSSE